MGENRRTTENPVKTEKPQAAIQTCELFSEEGAFSTAPRHRESTFLLFRKRQRHAELQRPSLHSPRNTEELLGGTPFSSPAGRLSGQVARGGTHFRYTLGVRKLKVVCEYSLEVVLFAKEDRGPSSWSLSNTLRVDLQEELMSLEREEFGFDFFVFLLPCRLCRVVRKPHGALHSVRRFHEVHPTVEELEVLLQARVFVVIEHLPFHPVSTPRDRTLYHFLHTPGLLVLSDFPPQRFFATLVGTGDGNFLAHFQVRSLCAEAHLCITEIARNEAVSTAVFVSGKGTPLHFPSAPRKRTLCLLLKTLLIEVLLQLLLRTRKLTALFMIQALPVDLLDESPQLNLGSLKLRKVPPTGRAPLCQVLTLASFKFCLDAGPAKNVPSIAINLFRLFYVILADCTESILCLLPVTRSRKGSVEPRRLISSGILVTGGDESESQSSETGEQNKHLVKFPAEEDATCSMPHMY
mmetsp:Transcript_49764/g.98068  ORF Transcript_49764/g.98068 Transcript_49764/m.98068 type:complete len:465 (-) Transcript_49764:20-1414(-)